MKSIQELFPNASADTVKANPHLMGDMGNDLALGRGPTSKNALQPIVATKRRGSMNKTEAEYAMILEAMKRKGEILRYEFEGVTLRFSNVKYTPDFVVFGWTGDGSERYNGFGYTGIKLIEVKGPFIKGNRERAVERFRHAKTYWTEFTFEMMQKTSEGWKQII